MATIDLSNATLPINMSFGPNPASFATLEAGATSTAFAYFSPTGNRIAVQGNFVLDNAGRPAFGTITAFSIDLGNNNPAVPDIVVTNLAIPVSKLVNGVGGLWNFLSGDDVIIAPQNVQGASDHHFALLGDGAAPDGAVRGGNDSIFTGNGSVSANGDVRSVVGSAGVAVAYRGGNDEIIGLDGLSPQDATGDVGFVIGKATLTGGNDTIVIRSGGSSTATGDVSNVTGIGARVLGGMDTISAGATFKGQLVGDVYEQGGGTFVRGGADTITGGDLNDVIAGDVLNVRGQGTTQLIGGNDTIDGGIGEDKLYGDVSFVENAITLKVTGGHDIIHGGADSDTIYGDTAGFGTTIGGNDRLYGDNGNDGLVGEGGDDALNGGQGEDRLYGGIGNDDLYGGSEADLLQGGAGNDLMDGGAGPDNMYGEAGNDIYYTNDRNDLVLEGDGLGIDTINTTLASTVLGRNIENLRYIGISAFTGVGNELGNQIVGSAGNDNLHGAEGNDRLEGGFGADRIGGGNGSDIASYAGSSQAVRVSLDGSITATSDAAGDVFTAIEGLLGTSFNDVLVGDDKNNTLNGSLGNDQLVGQIGTDLLVGALGADTVTGGIGADRFVFNSVKETTVAASGRDRVTDFNHTQGDRIALGSIDANTKIAGNQAFKFIGKAAFSKHGGELHFKQGSTTIVEGDVDGNGKADFQILLTGSKALVASDFVL